MVTMGPYLFLGLVAGVMSGLIGIGGGIVIVPVLVFLFGFSQHQAQGTTLAMMVPPIGILAAWTYFKQGCVDLGGRLMSLFETPQAKSRGLRLFSKKAGVSNKDTWPRYPLGLQNLPVHQFA